MDIDLALLTFEELRHLAKQHPIDGAESKRRVDLVVSLRQAGVGVTPIKADEVSTSSSLKSLNELVCVVIELREQLEQAKHDNAIVSSLRDEVSSLKLEVLELRNFTTGALSQTANDTHNRRSSANEVTVEPSLYETDTSITTAPQSQHTSTSQHARSSSNDRTTGMHSQPRAASQSRDTTRTAPRPASNGHVTTDSSSRNKSDGQSSWVDVVRRRVTSRYVKPMPTVETNPVVLTGVEKVDKAIFYVGNVHMGCSADSIKDWCQERAVDVLNCTILESRTFGTAYARVTFPASATEKVLGDGFWPATIQHTVRKWRFADSNTNKPGKTSTSSE